MRCVFLCFLLFVTPTAAVLQAAEAATPAKKPAQGSTKKKAKTSPQKKKATSKPQPEPSAKKTTAPPSPPVPETQPTSPEAKKEAAMPTVPERPPASLPTVPERKLESLLLMPEPRVMRTALSILPAGAQHTVLTPYRESPDVSTGLEPHTPASLQKLGLSVETFAQRARTAADRRLLQMQPELIKGEDGRVAYAVYRGESSLFATLLMAPSLPKVFEPLFGKEIWVAMPDRHALYVFPPNPDLLASFTSDLAERYATDPYAASAEVFSLKEGQEPQVVAGFAAAQE